ncbi:hypothetical protein JDV02_004211 [Purpureocillium takamizusanense]|uniref:N-acetyltransferase domain-containing protein n=1 Tax=Purpureocillium takamizusanense TaxID=2060973 RepID=A0A9Q8QC21_9HYPO|nr:uncharacterized protein JDV02_004211 [Purpureocillium takamizusanense]UNI17904.1 hypothetical protein JDV02_004211 [Purpureocillium takamizusanense]
MAAAIVIRSATAADQDAIARIHYEALNAYHDFYAAFFRTHPRELLTQSTRRAFAETNFTFLVAEETTINGSETVGFIRYKIVQARPDNAQDEKSVESSQPSLLARKDHLEHIWERFTEREKEMDACYEAAATGKRHFFVNHLMVHPRHQRRGVGGMLLREVTARSDDEGVPTLIVASAEARGLYVRCGFAVLGEWTIDNGYWAAEIERHEQELGIGDSRGLGAKFKGVKEIEAYMIREPPAVRLADG